ncbi:MAG: aminotransferase class I/II-fold pyridoxal phosphate-dependent enzyme [Caldisericia bacterium]|nr:aminotransferase class I/II-fold pyridoxal phosphate-dependent enzyme [Caldisericia bacterium]
MNNFAKRFEMIQQKQKQVIDDGHFILSRVIERNDSQYVWIGGKKYLNFTSYNYLGLLGDERVNKAAIDATNKFGTGSHAIRLLCGTTTVHTDFEKKIAQFHGMDDAILYSSGYLTNLTTVSTLCMREDEIFCDNLNHASIIDGCLLSRSKFTRFAHNNPADLEEKLKASKSNGKFIVLDAVFSMDGDVTPLPEMIKLAKKYDALLMVDESHSLGVIGKNGLGIMEHFGIKDGVDIIMCSLSKFASITGGYIAARKEIVDMLRFFSRGYVFSAPMPPGTAAAAHKTFDILEQESWRVHKLNENITYYLEALKREGFDTGNSTTAIVPIIIGDEYKAYELSKQLFEEGVYLMPILPPAVPVGTARMRCNVTSMHEKADIDYMVNKLAQIWNRIGMGSMKINVDLESVVA